MFFGFDAVFIGADSLGLSVIIIAPTRDNNT